MMRLKFNAVQSHRQQSHCGAFSGASRGVQSLEREEATINHGQLVPVMSPQLHDFHRDLPVATPLMKVEVMFSSKAGASVMSILLYDRDNWKVN
jgi:hypothetical protein